MATVPTLCMLISPGFALLASLRVTYSWYEQNKDSYFLTFLSMIAFGTQMDKTEISSSMRDIQSQTVS